MGVDPIVIDLPRVDSAGPAEVPRFDVLIPYNPAGSQVYLRLDGRGHEAILGILVRIEVFRTDSWEPDGR